MDPDIAVSCEIIPGPSKEVDAHSNLLDGSHGPNGGGPVFHHIDDCEHPLLYLPGTGIASQETAISGSF